MKISFDLKKTLSVFLLLSMMLMLLGTTGCGTRNYLENAISAATGADPGDDWGDGSTSGGKDGYEGRADFIREIGGVSETYVGTVSEMSYSSATEAASAYVTEEIAGDSYVSNVNYTSSRTLSSSEIAGLGLPSDVMYGINGVEEMVIEYTLGGSYGMYAGDVPVVPLADTLDTTGRVKVYAIKYDFDWKYFTPAPITGDTITKSYYDSVFNAEQYKNCTLNTYSTVSAVVSGVEAGQTLNVTVSMTITQLIKHANDRVYVEQTVEMVQNGSRSTNTLYAYMEKVDGYTKCYAKTDPYSSSWYPASLTTIGFSDLEELTPFHNQYLDYTYFTKTDYGFALGNDNAERYFMQAMDSLGMMESLPGEADMDVDMFAEYYVSAGVLSGMRTDADVTVEVTASGTSVELEESVLSTVTCTNYGSTYIERPFID